MRDLGTFKSWLALFYYVLDFKRRSDISSFTSKTLLNLCNPQLVRFYQISTCSIKYLLTSKVHQILEQHSLNFQLFGFFYHKGSFNKTKKAEYLEQYSFGHNRALWFCVAQKEHYLRTWWSNTNIWGHAIWRPITFDVITLAGLINVNDATKI